MSALTSSGRSRLGRCDAPATVSSRAPPIEPATWAAMPCMSAMSSSPTITSVGQRHVAEPLVDRRLEDGLLVRLVGALELVRAEHHLAHARPQLLVDLVRRAARPVDPLPQARLGRRLEVAPLERLLLGGPAGAGLVRPGPAGQPRRDQHEPLDEIGPEHRELERDATAERGADDGRRAVEQRLGVARVGERLRPHRALPEPAQIGRNHVESGGTKRRLLRAPHAAVGDAGVQQQGSAQDVLQGRGVKPVRHATRCSRSSQRAGRRAGPIRRCP